MKSTAWPSPPPKGRWNRLRALRRACGLTQMELAVGAGVILPTITELEGGMGSRRGPEAYRRIAGFLNCEVEDIWPAEMVGSLTLDEFIESALKKSR